jgi:hypothetical protein
VIAFPSVAFYQILFTQIPKRKKGAAIFNGKTTPMTIQQQQAMGNKDQRDMDKDGVTQR